MVTGRSEKPVYLHVKDDHVSLEDAEFICLLIKQPFFSQAKK